MGAALRTRVKPLPDRTVFNKHLLDLHGVHIAAGLLGIGESGVHYLVNEVGRLLGRKAQEVQRVLHGQAVHVTGHKPRLAR